MRIAFIKCHGSGNDFPLIDGRAGAGAAVAEGDWPAIARALADRSGPVGGDGLLLLTPADETHAFGMRMFNSDGSEAETCLNGLRCVARLGLESAGLSEARVRLKTSSAWVARDNALAPGVATIAETVGPATRDVRGWPLIWPQAAGGGPDSDGRLTEVGIPMLADVAGAGAGAEALRFTAIAIPNPHLIAFVEAVDDALLARIGAICEGAPDWLPNRANVSFVEVRAGGTTSAPDLFVRTFERGVGLTNSCGSAMAASTYAACMTGRAPFGQELRVLNRGGIVRALAGEDAVVRLSGNATFEWAGAVTLDVAAVVARDLQVTVRHADEVAAWENLLEHI